MPPPKIFHYTRKIPYKSPESEQNTTTLVAFWLTVLLLAIGFASAWAEHFSSGFHLQDSHVIQANRAIRDLHNVPHFFVSPKTYSARPEEAEYQPLLSTSLAIDYKLAPQMDPLFFQIENFFWFLLELALLYVLFRLIPGGDIASSLAAAILCGFHPLAAETVNYTLQRGMIYSAIGVIAGLIIWIVWPRMLPADFILKGPKIPATSREAFRARMRPKLSFWYRTLIGLPVPFYLIVVVAGMLAGPSGIAFVPILIAWMLLFEPERGLRPVIPVAVVAGALWIFQLSVVLTHRGQPRIPLLNWLATEPWVTLRYLYSFLVPVRLNTFPDLTPFAPWAPLALAGFAGVAGVVWLAVSLARKPEWRAVSFGLWWFLLALLPFALIPQQDAEAFPRMFLAYAGLVMALTRTAFILLGRLKNSMPVDAVFIAGGLAGLLVLTAWGWETHWRNEIWESDETLWENVLQRNPQDGRALMNYAVTFMDPVPRDAFSTRNSIAFDYLTRAAKVLPGSAAVETNLAIVCEQLGRDTDAGMHFKRAIALDAGYAPAYAAYSQWLLNHLRLDEAFTFATKAAELDPVDVSGHRTLADIYLERNDWPNALKLATQALQTDPDDQGALSSLHVAQAGMAANESTLQLAKAEPSVDHFLAVSVLYYKEGKYQECIQAGQEALKIRPEAVEAWINIAAAWHAMGNETETVAALRAALKIKPDFALAKHNLEVELATTPPAAR